MASATGTATISGNDSQWKCDLLTVGYRGPSTMNITGGATVMSVTGSIAGYTGSTNCIVTVSGTDSPSGNKSTWNTETLSVGEKGSGSLNISDGGTVSVSGHTYVGRSSSGLGTIHFDTGGTLNTIGLHAGASELLGVGTITTNGLVSDVDLVFDATTPSNQQTISINSDSQLATQDITIQLTQTEAGDLGVGYRGTGSLTIQGGVTVSSYGGYLGKKLGSSGTATVSGNGSTWNNANYLFVGGEGTGTLDINGGATVLSGDSTSAKASYIGSSAGSTGTVTISDSGSTWTNRDDLYVGYYGAGTLEITEGSLVSVAGTLHLDYDGNGDSFVNLASGGKLALFGEADDSLDDFLGLIDGTDALQWWDDTIGEEGDWALLNATTPTTNYSLEYIDDITQSLGGYTILTVTTSTEQYLPGDANQDGRVDGSDVTILAGNWQTLTGATWSMGDFNGDKKVDGSDVTILAGNWQAGVTTSAATAVPEPSTILLLLTALLAAGLAPALRHSSVRNRPA